MPEGDIRFDNKVAVITGAGAGLGRSHALLLAGRGARVVVNDLGGNPDGTGASEGAADLVVKEILESGGEAVANYDSVATPEGGAGVIQTAVDAYGTVDIVINNAGILRDKSFAKLDPADLNAVLDVHLKGSFFVSQPAFRIMKDKGYGRLVHTTSAAGLFGNFGQANYAAAKMGIVGLSNVLAIEGAKANIRSNVIAPMAKTRLTESLLGPMADAVVPEQVSGLVAYLASEECELTHETFSVGGGRIGRVYMAETPGWGVAKGAAPTIEGVRDNLTQIMDTDGFIIPKAATDEMPLFLAQFQES
jgi:NAD(P)-dependent dehydrogenase (short-subunit alcohol dehydrogenase family)